MENKFRYILIILAVASAAVLYFIGFRRMKNLSGKKRNFFIASLLIALAFIGCDISGSNAKNNNEDLVQNKNNPGKDDPERIKELNKTNEWKEFKQFWKSLDAIEPGVPFDSLKNYSYMPYAKAKSKDADMYDLAERMRKKIDAFQPGLQSLADKNLLDTLEIKLLKQICQSRISYIFFGSTSMMTRMVPLPGLLEKERSILVLEHRIDLLLDLKKKGKIDSTELKKTIANINIEIGKFSVLEIIGRNHLEYYPYDYGYGDFDKSKADTISVLDRSILNFDKSYNEFMHKYDAAKADEQAKLTFDSYIRTKMELDIFSRIRPQFYELIKDLVVND